MDGEKLVAALEALGRELDRQDLEPDPGRADWAQHADAVAQLRGEAEALLEGLEPALLELASEVPDPREALRSHAAQLVGEVAAVLHAASRRDAAARLLGSALAVGATGSTRDELESARREPDAYVLLVLGRWHQRAGDFAGADAIFARARRAATDPSLRRIVDRCLDGPRPLTSGAPPLFRLNGFGVGLYGTRDGWDDGSHVSTYCVSAAFIPVFPLAAYRVIDHGDGGYTFIAKEKLSAFARGFRWLLVGALAVGAVALAVRSHLESPERLARLALEEAEQSEQAGRAEEAAAGYQRVVDEHPLAPDEVVGAAALGLVRVLTARVEEPLTADRADEVRRVVRRYTALRQGAQGGRAASHLARRLESWSEQLGAEGARGRRPALRLADLGREVAQGPDRARLGQLAARLHVELAREVREEWPLEALQHYVAAGTPEALGEATAIVASLDASLLSDAAEEVERWSSEVSGAAEAHAHVAGLRRELAAREGDPNRTRALEEGDAEALALLYQERPSDQEVAAALADARRATGDVDGALALLVPYGAPGRLSARAQRALAGCYADQGRLEDADALLARQVELLLPAFQDAQRAYDGAAERRTEALLASARAGRESDLETRLAGVMDTTRGNAIVSEWLRGRLTADRELSALREAYVARAPVVSTVLTLGTLKLRRAHESRGEERAALLAEAERLFLSIREEAEGVPAFHISLGQVYHRLGRREDGERELGGVLAQGDPATSLGVANVYRELGLVARAREVAEAVYRDSPSDESSDGARSAAAITLSTLARRLEDEELWLGRAQQTPELRIRLVSVRARRALREGDRREAERLLSEVVAHYERDAESSAAAANNGAIARQERYLCSGDVRDLDRATALQEQSLRLAPDNAIVLGNVAEMMEYRGGVRLLERWVRTQVLRPGSRVADSLLGALRAGPLAEELAQASREDPSIRRSRELTRQEQALAPQSLRPWLRDWRRTADDQGEEELAALLSRLRAVEGIDGSEVDDEREHRNDAEREAQRRSELDSQVLRAEGTLEEAAQARHAPTIAAARFHLASSLLARALEQADLADARRSLELARQARAGWDALGSDQVAGALTSVALLETMEQAPSLRALFDEQGHDLAPALLLREAIRREPSLAGALRARPELSEAAGLRAQARPDDLGIDDLALAEVADHAGLRAVAAPVRSRARTLHELEALLFPHHPVVEARRAILEQ